MDDTKTSLDVEAIKKDFPILSTKMSGKPLVYLDSAATSQKPMQVIDAITEYYKKYNANIHRGIYEIAEEATEKYEESKSKIAKMIGAESTENIIYVRNTTEALNLIALTWAEQNISEGDVILISEMEHHSNIVPWLLLSKRKKAKLEYIKVDRDTGLLNDESAKEKLENKPKLVSITYASNVLGTINDVKKISETAHKNGAMVVVDAAQAVPHMKVDVKGIDCDFMAFFRSQNARPYRNRCSVREKRHSERNGAHNGRRRHDKKRKSLLVHMERSPMEIRSRNLKHRGRYSAGGRCRLSE